MRISKLSTQLTILGALGGLAAVTTSNDADALIRRVHSSACHYYYDNAGTEVFNGEYISVSSSAATQKSIYCDAPSDSELEHSNVGYLRVDGYQPANGTNYSRACVKSYSGTSFSCGTFDYWTTTGVSDVDVSTWDSNPTYYPYVVSVLKPGTRLHGFYFTN